MTTSNTPILLCLHGWGASKEAFDPLREALDGSGITILAPDLPGFGEAGDPRRPFTNEDYVAWVQKYIAEHIDGPFALLGHSHGGRTALKLCIENARSENPLPITHLFLCAPAGIRHTRHLKRIFGLTLAKTGKFFLTIPGLRALQPLGKKLLYKLVRVHDYEKASPIMRQTLINVTREDLRPYINEISVPVDLFWGKRDGMVPYSDALVMEHEIAGSTLHTYNDSTHRVHKQNVEEIAAVISAKLG